MYCFLRFLQTLVGFLQVGYSTYATQQLSKIKTIWTWRTGVRRKQPDTGKSGTGGSRGTDERDGAGTRAAGSRKRPTGPHNYNSLVSGIYVRIVGAL